MAIELGKAYVQIMPSAKGITGSIQKAIAPEALNAGKAAGKNIASAISESLSKAGSTLTKSITAPALAATTAVAGLVGALGFKRLVGMDEARAKLKGLGVEGKQLSQVMTDAENAVRGTTHTMADAVNVAAGAIAAGVKEGAELERYIKLVGDAATGAKVPMGEMAQIFNRVQSAGKITREELEMINYRLPGFANALQEHVGAASQDAFYEMLRAGKVSSKDMLEVMEDFAGGMSAAYAETFSGLKDNVLANIGIIGQTLLSGVFEQSKESLAEFLEYLRSDDLKAWAQNTGKVIGDTFTKVIGAVKSTISWWSNLDGSTKKIFGAMAGIAVAIGPVLMVVGKMLGTISTLIGTIGSLSKGLTAIKGGFMAAKAGGVVASGAMAKLGGVIATLLGPVGLIIGAVVGLIALFTVLYQKNEGFRDLVHNAWNTIKETISTVIQTISDFVMEIWGNLVEWWNENNELISQSIQVVWEYIQKFIGVALKTIVPNIKTAWEIIKTATSTVWNVIKIAIDTVLKVVMGLIKAVMQIITGDWKGAWNTIKSTVMTYLTGAKNIIQTLLRGAFNIIVAILNNIKGRFSSIFNGLRNIVSGAFNGVRSAVSNGIRSAYNAVINFISRFKDAGRRIVTSIADGIKGAISTVTDAVYNVAKSIRAFFPFSPPETGPMIDGNEQTKKNANDALIIIEKITNLSLIPVEGLVL